MTRQQLQWAAWRQGQQVQKPVAGPRRKRRLVPLVLLALSSCTPLHPAIAAPPFEVMP